MIYAIYKSLTFWPEEIKKKALEFRTLYPLEI
jgi:hypothetical protein